MRIDYTGQGSNPSGIASDSGLAAVLKTRDFKFFNVRRNREVQDSVFRRWGLNLRICVTLIENPLAPDGLGSVHGI